MPLTVADLLEVPGLGLSVVAGRDGIDRPIRWVHTSELPDPTRWLSGGELLLTTGIGMKGSPNHQRSYLKRLAGAGLAGLGLGVGLGFDAVPAPILRAADREGFPVLEVPYQVPFIAIGEAVASAFAKDRTRELEMSEEIHDRMARLITLGSGATEILEEIVRMAPGWVYLFTSKGEVVGRAVSDAVDAPDADMVWAKLPAGFAVEEGAHASSLLDPSASVLAVGLASAKASDGVMVFGRRGRLEVRDRLVVRHAVTVLGLLLASRRAVAEVERGVAGEVLAGAIEGELTGPPLLRRLEQAGFPPGADLTVLVAELPGPHEDLGPFATLLEDRLSEGAERARVAVVTDRVVGVVVHPDPAGLARRVEQWLSEEPQGLEGMRIGVGEPVPPAELRDSFLSATLALRAAPESVRVATRDDLGAYRLLMGSQPRDVLEGFVRSVLGPLMERDAERGSELVASVRAFVEAGGRWEEGAQALGVHRHTLRYRVNQAQEFLPRDLFDPEDRMEIWLACKAADTLSPPF